VLEEWVVETMWAEPVGIEQGLYRIDSIPFYGPLAASDDIVFAEYDNDEQRLTYRRTVEHSGNSIITVVMMDKSHDIDEVRDIFKDLGCLSERVNDGYFSMEILFDKYYGPIKHKLSQLEDQGIIGYAEPCLSEKHRAEI
jgi:hypothetical protein